MRNALSRGQNTALGPRQKRWDSLATINALPLIWLFIECGWVDLGGLALIPQTTYHIRWAVNGFRWKTLSKYDADGEGTIDTCTVY